MEVCSVEITIKFIAGTDVMIFYTFSPKNSAKKLAILTQNKAELFKILSITLVFEKNANFFAKNCEKSQKICDHNIDPWSVKQVDATALQGCQMFLLQTK
jgi:hypothetical protein